MKRRKPKQEERRIQRGVCELLAIHERQGRLSFASVPNNPRNPVAGAHLKATGMRAGFPDLIVILPGSVEFWEVKSATGRLQVDQELWRQAIERHGHRWRLIRSVADAEMALESLA